MPAPSGKGLWSTIIPPKKALLRPCFPEVVVWSWGIGALRFPWFQGRGPLEVPHSQIPKCETVACWGSEATGMDGWISDEFSQTWALFELKSFRRRRIKHMQNTSKSNDRWIPQYSQLFPFCSWDFWFNKSHGDWLPLNEIYCGFFREDLLQEPTWMGWVISETCEHGGMMWEEGKMFPPEKCVKRPWEKNVQAWFFEKDSLATVLISSWDIDRRYRVWRWKL